MLRQYCLDVQLSAGINKMNMYGLQIFFLFNYSFALLELLTLHVDEFILQFLAVWSLCGFILFDQKEIYKIVYRNIPVCIGKFQGFFSFAGKNWIFSYNQEKPTVLSSELRVKTDILFFSRTGKDKGKISEKEKKDTSQEVKILDFGS